MTAGLYIMSRPDGILKFGWTVNVRRRRSHISSATGISHTIEHMWSLDDRTAQRIEARIHYKLKKMRVRGHGSIELYPASAMETLVNEVESMI